MIQNSLDVLCNNLETISYKTLTEIYESKMKWFCWGAKIFAEKEYELISAKFKTESQGINSYQTGVHSQLYPQSYNKSEFEPHKEMKELVKKLKDINNIGEMHKTKIKLRDHFVSCERAACKAFLIENPWKTLLEQEKKAYDFLKSEEPERKFKTENMGSKTIENPVNYGFGEHNSQGNGPSNHQSYLNEQKLQEAMKLNYYFQETYRNVEKIFTKCIQNLDHGIQDEGDDIALKVAIDNSNYQFKTCLKDYPSDMKKELEEVFSEMIREFKGLNSKCQHSNELAYEYERFLKVLHKEDIKLTQFEKVTNINPDDASKLLQNIQKSYHKTDQTMDKISKEKTYAKADLKSKNKVKKDTEMIIEDYMDKQYL